MVLQFLARISMLPLAATDRGLYFVWRQLLEQVAGHSCFFPAGGKVDLLRAAVIVLATRGGKMGDYAERPPSHDQQGDQDA